MNIMSIRVVLQADRQFIDSNNKKTRRKRTALSDTTLWMKSRGRLTIDDDRKSSGRDASVN
jgi:hypothetical protein